MSKALAIHKHFEGLNEPRLERCRQHKLLDIITIALCGVICGAEGWTEIEAFGNAKEQWFKEFLDLPSGIPSHDTFGRFFSAIEATEFEQCFLSWVQTLVKTSRGSVVAIDGKRVRGSYDKTNGKAAIHMVSAWCELNNVVLGQVKTSAKSNEITAIPELIDLLDLNGATVTIDAMGCQKKIAYKIKSAGANYVLALKGNQSQLHEDVQETFKYLEGKQYKGVEHETYTSLEGDHGRVEQRKVTVIPVRTLSWTDSTSGWEGLTHIVKVNSTRNIDGEELSEARFYLSGLDSNCAEIHAHAIRTHWGVENKLHWSLDVAFSEDKSRIRIGHAAENLSVLRRFALNLLKNDKSKKVGVKTKRMAAGWDESYLVRLISAA